MPPENFVGKPQRGTASGDNFRSGSCSERKPPLRLPCCQRYHAKGRYEVMQQPETERLAVGFLSVLRCEEQGYQGGYLIVDRHGHPLSFHCTEPVQPNRIQQILYGMRLEPYLLGQRIAAALIEKGRPRPQLVLTDHGSVLAAAQVCQVPLAWVVPAKGSESSAESPAEVVPASSSPAVSHGRWHLVPAAAQGEMRQQLEQWLQQLDPTLELDEPFERIRLALEEARRAA